MNFKMSLSAVAVVVVSVFAGGCSASSDGSESSTENLDRGSATTGGSATSGGGSGDATSSTNPDAGLACKEDIACVAWQHFDAKLCKCVDDCDPTAVPSTDPTDPTGPSTGCRPIAPKPTGPSTGSGSTTAAPPSTVVHGECEVIVDCIGGKFWNPATCRCQLIDPPVSPPSSAAGH